MRFICNTSYHILNFAKFMTPSIVLLIIIPLLQLINFYKVCYDPKSLYNYKFQVKYGILVNEYRIKVFYFEIFKIARNITTIIIMNTLVQNYGGKLILVIVLNMGITIITYKLHPYFRKFVQIIDLTSIQVINLTLLFGLYQYLNISPQINIILLLLMIVINLFFLLFVFANVLKQTIYERRVSFINL